MAIDIKLYLSSGRDQINAALDQFIDDHPNSPRIKQAMRYSLAAGGKRIRPILCMAAAEAAGGLRSSVILAACAIEMIHTYSLIHDDLPAMDNDRLRRGKPTCHIAFDEATAILAGDALLTLSFEILASAQDSHPAPTILRIIRIIASASGYQGMIEGQMRDILYEGTALPFHQIQELHQLKTGRLIEASLQTGAILGGAADHQVDQLASYGRYIGLAFQVSDDILNMEGDPVLLGKAAGTDAVRKKNTYPSVIGLEQSKALGNKLIHNALTSLETFDEKAEPLRSIANYIMERKQ